MTPCIQIGGVSKYRSRRQDKYLRRAEMLKRMRAAKARKREESIAAGLLEREPKMQKWHRFEIGIRNKDTGETCFVDLKSGRQAHKIAGLVLKYL